MGDVGRGVYCAMNLQLGVYNPTKFEICETPPKTMRLLKPKAEIRWDLGTDVVDVWNEVLHSDLKVFPWAFKFTKGNDGYCGRYVVDNGYEYSMEQRISEPTLLIMSYLLFKRRAIPPSAPLPLAAHYRSRDIVDPYGRKYCRLKKANSSLSERFTYDFRRSQNQSGELLWVIGKDGLALARAEAVRWEAVQRCLDYLREKLPQVALWPCRPQGTLCRFIVTENIATMYWHQVLLPGLTHTADKQTGIMWAKKQAGDERHVDVYISFQEDNDICEIAWDDALA